MAVARSPERESQLFHILREGPANLVNTPSDYQDLTFDKLLVYYAAKDVQLPRRTFRRIFACCAMTAGTTCWRSC